MKSTTFQVDKSNLYDAQFITNESPANLNLGKKEVLLRIDSFAFTSNNVTYGVSGDAIGYWHFFPVDDENKGIIPCWGFATVVSSNNMDVKEGEQFYGFYPMSTHVKMLPTKHTDFGFVDGAEHRKALPSAYNYYYNTSSDQSLQAPFQHLQSLFRPLYITSFLINEFLIDSKYFDAKNVILTSASSKTALGLAFLLHAGKSESNIKVLALTSSGNISFLEGLGYYDKVYAYQDIQNLPKESSIIVDFTGNHNVQLELQEYLDTDLVHNCLVGLVDWKNIRGKTKLPAKGKFFFAPSHAENKIRTWGSAEFNKRISQSVAAFLTEAKDWLSVEVLKNNEDFLQLYKNMLDGDISPSIGYIAQLK